MFKCSPCYFLSLPVFGHITQVNFTQQIAVWLQLQLQLLPEGLNVILSSDWPVVVTGLVQWVGLWERPGWLSTLETLDRPVRSVAVWGGKKNIKKVQAYSWQKDSGGSVSLAVVPSRVWTEVEIWPQSSSGFPLGQLSLCVLCCRHFCYCWWCSQHTNLPPNTESWKHSLSATCSEFNKHWPNSRPVNILAWVDRNNRALIQAADAELIVTCACGWWRPTSVGWRLVRELEWFIRAWEVLEDPNTPPIIIKEHSFQFSLIHRASAQRYYWY